MSSSRRRAFYYQANANAFGGRLDQPFEQVLPVLAPTSLPSAGGYASARHEEFHVGEILSIARSSTQVAGSRSASGSFTTLVTSVVEGLNVNNILFADRIVAQISTSFSEDHAYPRVSFLGTAFEGLRIGGIELEPAFNLGICDGGERYPAASALHNREFQQRVRQQGGKFREYLDGLSREERAYHEWIHDYADAGSNLEDEISQRGSLLCSVVEEIETVGGSLPGTQVGHAIHIPDFGRIFLAELIVGHHSFDLTMLRLELGCPASGTISVAQASSSGTVIGHRGSGGGTTTQSVTTASSLVPPPMGSGATNPVATVPSSGPPAPPQPPLESSRPTATASAPVPGNLPTVQAGGDAGTAGTSPTSGTTTTSGGHRGSGGGAHTEVLPPATDKVGTDSGG